jgi:uncharacterized protein
MSQNHQTSRAQGLIVLGLFCAVAGLVISALTLSEYSSSFGGRVLLLARMPFLALVATLLLRRDSRKWSDIGAARPRWRNMLIWVPLGYLLVLITALPVKLLLVKVGAPLPDYSAVMDLKGNLPLYLLWGIPMAWLSAALCEEFVFRGYVQDALSRLVGSGSVTNSWFPTVAQGLLFGLLHAYQGISGVAVGMAAGLTLGIIWRLSGRNLWAGVVVHGLIDFGSLTVIYFGVAP